MHVSLISSLELLICLSVALRGHGAPNSPSILVTLDYGTFRGQRSENLIQFLGMPFASPPIGKLRFAPPTAPQRFQGIRKATSYGAACGQQELIPPSVPGLDTSGLVSVTPVNTSEDCLFINVIKPANIPKGKILPVLFWIYGGGFEIGDTAQNPGNNIVNRSLALDEPVIHVSANYRLNAFGFLGGKEVKAAGIANAGIRDQRFALEWVQKYITDFGGDPKRVTIWGESAGAVSIGTHMILNNGNPAGLFQGAFMQSGSILVLPDVLDQQQYFDQLVNETNCTGSADLLDCLRGVPFDQLVTAINQTPSIFSFQSMKLAWMPMVDGIYIVRDPFLAVQSGNFAKIPFVIGDCEDEGTAFSLSTLNITTNTEYLTYMQNTYFPSLDSQQLNALEQAYTDDITQGSPFNTGTANAITLQYKRLAAIQGDLVYQAPRRFLLQAASKYQATYSFRYLRGAGISVLGIPHGSDLPEFQAVADSTDFIGTDAVIYFVNNGDPNAHSDSTSLLREFNWKTWSSSATNPPLLTFIDGQPPINITFDTFRAGPMKVLNNLLLDKASIF